MAVVLSAVVYVANKEVWQHRTTDQWKRKHCSRVVSMNCYLVSYFVA